RSAAGCVSEDSKRAECVKFTSGWLKIPTYGQRSRSAEMPLALFLFRNHNLNLFWISWYGNCSSRLKQMEK
ncbi:hypothetical protein, partial [Vibrio sp. 1580]|uniref:hypothetical protein n=1 Tax=Vibrio sp. 1580 TaxID=3074567 RepID=UPI002964C776